LRNAARILTPDLRAADREQRMFVQRWLPSIREQLARDEVVEVENTRAMSPLSTLSIGLEPVIPFRFASTKEGLRFGQGRGSTNPLDVLLGYLDITFIVSTVLSLLALTFTFDSISGEKVQGTLSFLLSYPL